MKSPKFILSFTMFVVCLFSFQAISQTCPTSPTYNSNTNITATTGQRCSITGSVSVPSNRSPNINLTGGNNTGGDIFITGNLILNGNSTINLGGDTLYIGGNLTLEGNGDISVTTGVLYVGGNLTVNGNALFGAGGNVVVKGNFTVTGSNAAVTVSGGFSVAGTADLGTETLTIQSGAVFVADSLATTGAVTVGSGGTIYVTDGLGSPLSVTSNPANGDTACETCCGANCNTAGTALDPTAQATLPILLAQITAKVFENNILISWSTVSELNFEKFELYKYFEKEKIKVATINSTGNSNGDSYSWIDSDTDLGLNIYQLRSVDFDGYSEWFSPISIIFQPDNIKFQVYPNPSDGSNFLTDIYDQFILDIYLPNGQKITSHNISDKDLTPIYGLHPGLYIFKMNINGLIVTQRVIVD